MLDEQNLQMYIKNSQDFLATYNKPNPSLGNKGEQYIPQRRSGVNWTVVVQICNVAHY